MLDLENRRHHNLTPEGPIGELTIGLALLFGGFLIPGPLVVHLVASGLGLVAMCDSTRRFH